MTSKDIAKKEIQALVQKFEEHKSEYRASEYNETQTRRDFIDPFFEALGWDISNKNKLSEAYRDVIHEDRVKVENKLKSPDYSFRINGRRYFFVEAKKPSVNIKDDIQPAYQVKRYAWSAKLKISIATDFEEFAVYDCTTKPDPSDKATKARIEYIKYDEYIKKFDFIWDTFSKEAVLSGNHDKFLKIDKKKGTTSVDDDFLESLDKWRTTLAIDLYKNNPKLSEDYLNLVVQNTIDRIIFLRIAEDRSVETYGNIQKCLKEKNVYQALFKLFTDADDKYNSGLFNFEKDKISKSVEISNKCLNDIIDDLYFPKSPYEFSVIPVEILGSAYEQFLGKTIQLKNNKIVIEEKPEVRKAGGVYYTPQYIVDYIVQNTVGKLIEGKTPKEIEKIKILDPASGSGSFLLGAYDFLLKYHLDWYSKNTIKSKGKKEDPLNPDGSLTTEIKKKVLLNNIFGVDIDSGAVEVTKLSLLLKCLEGETHASIKSQLSLFNNRVLPTLDQNIKCGNSLISTDFYDMESNQTVLKKIKPFNWQVEFKEIFKNGGFDAVIGNPPYVFTRENFTTVVKEYFSQKFQVDYYKANLYQFFIEKSYFFKKDKGFYGYIIPVNWLTLETYKDLRRFILENPSLHTLIVAEDRVFRNANVDTCLLFCGDELSENLAYGKLLQSSFLPTQTLSKKQFNDKNHFIINPGTSLHNKSHNLVVESIEKESIKLEKLAIVKNGVQAYTVGEGTPIQTKSMKDSRIYHSSIKKDQTWIQYIDGVDVKRYKLSWCGQFIKYGKNLSRPRTPDLFEGERILIRQIPSKLPYAIVSCITDKKIINDNNSMIVKSNDGAYSNKLLIGILNSKLISFWFAIKLGKLQRKIFPQFKINELRLFPIASISVKKTPSKKAVEKIEAAVGKILDLSKIRDPDSAQILHYENEIDKLVYELYGLTEDEIKIVEEATSGN